MIAARTDDLTRIELGYKLAWGRPPDRSELDRALGFIRDASAGLAAENLPSEIIEKETWTSFAKVLLTANEFLYID